MEQLPIAYPRLGRKTLLVMIVKRCGAFVALACVAALSAVLAGAIPAAAPVLGPAIPYLMLLAEAALFLTLLAGWLQYRHYGIFLNAQDFKLTRGLVAEEEIGIPYRRIKEVKIERSVADELLGVSCVILTVLGDEGEGSSGKESRIILPSLDKSAAERIQDELLKRAEVEEINVDANT